MKKALILLALLAFLACGDEPRMATLYAGLDTPAMADFTAFLRENKYEYKLEKSDSTISVPKDKLYEIRMNLAKIGLLKGKTYILFDKETERNHHNSINYIRVIQSELARSIETLSEVEKARIYIKMKDTTAVVTVKLHPNQELQERRIKAIQHLVASAVNELKAERVSIIYDKEDKPTEDPDCCQDEVFR